MSSDTYNFEEVSEQVHESSKSAASQKSAVNNFFKIPNNGESFWDLPKTWRQDIPTLLDDTDLNVLVEYFAGVGEISGSSIRYRCPHPDHLDERPSFTVVMSPDGRQRARCWSQCDWHGDALNFVEWHLGIDTRDAIGWLTDWNETAVAISPLATTRETYPTAQLLPVDNSLTVSGVVANQAMADYLNMRDWPSNVEDQFSLSVVQEPNGDLRIRHPFFTPDREGIWTASYWQDRSVGSSDIKWKSPRNGTSTLFNLPSLENEQIHTVVICEGPADTITASVALRNIDGIAVIGVPGAQAWRPEYSQLVHDLKIVVAADNDVAGQLLESAICSSVNQTVLIARPQDGDITDTANIRGMSAVRELLMIAINQDVQNRQQDFNY